MMHVDEIHDLLDRVALATPHRLSMKIDRDLWEAFAPDRDSGCTIICEGPCERPIYLRGKGSTKVAGAIKEHAARMCSGCYRKSGKKTVRKQSSIRIGQPCKGPCKRPLRPNRTRIQDAPGTIKHRGYGMCSPCLELVGVPE